MGIEGGQSAEATTGRTRYARRATPRPARGSANCAFRRMSKCRAAAVPVADGATPAAVASCLRNRGRQRGPWACQLLRRSSAGIW